MMMPFPLLALYLHMYDLLLNNCGGMKTPQFHVNDGYPLICSQRHADNVLLWSPQQWYPHPLISTRLVVEIPQNEYLHPVGINFYFYNPIVQYNVPTEWQILCQC